MSRKTTSGPIRDKERTKKKFLDAVGKILSKDGFTGLNVSKIAMKANVDRKLIYEYFGGLEGLIKEYLNSRDYWKVSLDQRDAVVEKSKKDFGKQTLYDLLDRQFDSLMGNKEMRQVINWGLSENLQPLKELNIEREMLGEELFSKVTDDHFEGKDKNLRAIAGIAISSVYYLTLQARMSGATMCGIDINTKEGEEEIKKTLKQMIEWAYG